MIQHWSPRDSARGTLNLANFDPADHRSRNRLRIFSEIVRERPRWHECLLIEADVRQSGQCAHCIVAEQVKRIPSFRMPALSDPATLQNDVIDTGLREAATHGEACLASADDDDVRVAHGTDPFSEVSGRRAGARRPFARQTRVGILTPSVTGTPFVSTSNTAERAFDCITIFSSCSGVASPSISKSMLMPW